ncbi:hypothetical protein EDB87DRAFT_1624778 [Lactarius vividus]|nr:hypothetical protein EDB87DRAFT_1624778 [Lactarius vividus]
MESEPLAVEVVRFVATKQCIAYPSLFQAVRDFVAHDRKEKGLTAQYWGTSVERPNEFYWILLWQTRAHAAAFEEDPSYPAFAQRRQALASAPVLALFVRFSGNPLRCLDAPVTEIDVYRTQAADAATTQDKIRRITHRIESLQMPGFVALSWGAALEDVTRGAYIAGWRTIEDHMRLGTLEEHKVFVQETEEIFQTFEELFVTHVYFKPHETTEDLSLGEASV